MSEAAAPTIDEVVKKYIELRNQIKVIEAEVEARTNALKQAMQAIETYFMALANSTGQTKFGTPHGTAFITTKTACRVKDWTATFDFIKSNEMWFMLTKDVSKAAVQEYIDQHQTPPPGVDWTVMKAIQIRKS